MDPERIRLEELRRGAERWDRFGPYLSERAWATANLGTLIWLHGNLVGSAAKMGPDSVAPLELALRSTVLVMSKVERGEPFKPGKLVPRA